METKDPDDHKFGLPKPDFQKIPSQRSRWPIYLVLIIGLLVGIAKLIYDLLPLKISIQRVKNEQPAIMAQLQGYLGQVNEHGTTVEVNESLSYDDAFEAQKQISPKYNIQVVQNFLSQSKQEQQAVLVQPGAYRELLKPQGVYHLVVVSHLNRSTALHSAQGLAQKKMGVCIIVPRNGERYYRVTIAHSQTRHEAEEKLKQFSQIYKNLFILKY